MGLLDSAQAKWADLTGFELPTKRRRDFLTIEEADALIAAARANRYGCRDAAMMYLTYRHALRPSEVCELTWDQVHLYARPRPKLDIRRRRVGTIDQHPLIGDELAMLRELRRRQADSPFVFTSMRGKPFTPSGFGRMLERAGKAAGFEFKVSAAMLRNGCGLVMAQDGRCAAEIRQWLGLRPGASVRRFTGALKVAA